MDDRIRLCLGHRFAGTATTRSSTAAAPRSSGQPRLATVVVVAVTRWPRATSCGTSGRPKTPVPPAPNTRMTNAFVTSQIASSRETSHPGHL
jgi:hypothetical protein